MKWWFALLSAVLGFGLSWSLIVRARRAAAAATPVATVEQVATDEARDDEATGYGGEPTSDLSTWVADDAPSSRWQADAVDEDAVLHPGGEGTQDRLSAHEPTGPELEVPPVEGTVSGNGDLAGVTPQPRHPGHAGAVTATEGSEPEGASEDAVEDADDAQDEDDARDEDDAQDEDRRRP